MSSTSATAPVPRLRYQRRLGPRCREQPVIPALQATPPRDAPSVGSDEARRQSRRTRARPARRAPRTIAAVLAMLASTQVRAATLTVRQTTVGRTAGSGDRRCDAGARRRGSTGAPWCSRSPARPRRSRRSGPGASNAAAWSSVTRTGQPPAGAAPPRRRRRRGSRARPPPVRARRARRGAIGREGLRGRAEIELDASRDAHRAALLVHLDRPPARRRDEPSTRRGRARELGEVAVVAGQAQRSADRGIDVAVGESSGAKRNPATRQETAG